MDALDTIRADYEAELEVACALAIDGQMTRGQLTAELVRLALLYIGMMYAAGGGDIGSDKGKRYLQQQARIHRQSAAKLARDIFSGKYGNHR